MSESDEYYIDRCLDGHADDFRYLVRRYQAVLLAHLAGKLGSQDSAEEAAQESFVRAYFKMNKLKKRESFFRWLLTISDRVAKNHQRKEQRRRRREAVRPGSAAAQRPGLSQDYALEAAILKLKPEHKTIVTLRFFDNLEYEEIGQIMNVRPATLRVTLHRILKKLRNRLQPVPDGEG
jgi:RNA polymerase sigma-70 factor (ECF subfamily)